MKAFCFFLLVQCLTSSPSTTTMAQKLRGGGAADLLITEEDHRTLTSTCPSRVSASYQQGNNVIPCTQNSDCSGWSQDAPGCCLYPYCICGADIPGATSVVCLADSGTTRPEPPSSPLPLVYIGPTPRPAARPSALHLNPTAKPTARSTPKKHTSGSTVQPTSKPKPKMPTFKPTTKRTPSPLRKSTPAPALQVNRNELPSFATIDITPTTDKIGLHQLPQWSRQQRLVPPASLPYTKALQVTVPSFLANKTRTVLDGPKMDPDAVFTPIVSVEPTFLVLLLSLASVIRNTSRQQLVRP
jgi:hypothetical protein